MSEDKENQTVTETPEPKDKEKTTNEKPEFTPEQQDWINSFISSEKSKHKQEMDEYKKSVDASVDDKIKEQLEEQQRRANMTAEQKAEDDRKKLETENKQLQKELHNRKLVDYGRSIADKYEVPSNMVERLIGASDTETEKNMQDFSSAYKQAVQDGIDKRLASASKPQTGTPAKVDSTKKLSDLSLDEQTRLYHDDPDLYKQLMNN